MKALYCMNSWSSLAYSSPTFYIDIGDAFVFGVALLIVDTALAS